MRPPLLPLVALFLAAAASLAAQAKFTQPPAVTPNPNPRAPLAAIVKIDRVSGQVKWILGKPDGWAEKYRPLLFRAEGDLQWFQHQHSPFPTSRGTLIVFDNGNYGTMPFTPPKPRAETFSRAVEYQLDPERRTVRQVWASAQGPGPDTVLSEAMGNAEQLPGTGNVLVFYGALNRAGGGQLESGARVHAYDARARALGGRGP